MPPTDRLLAAVEAFYSPPSHERPRDRSLTLCTYITGLALVCSIGKPGIFRELKLQQDYSGRRRIVKGVWQCFVKLLSVFSF